MSATRSDSCNQLTGRFVVLEDNLSARRHCAAVRGGLEQHCEDSTPALFASIRYNSIFPATPFGGGYPRYTLNVTMPTHGIVTGEDLECGGTSTHCDRALAAQRSSNSRRSADPATSSPGGPAPVTVASSDDGQRQHGQDLRRDVRSACGRIAAGITAGGKRAG